MSKPILRAAALAAAMLAAGCASNGGLQPQARLHDANQLQAQHSLSHATLTAAAWPARDWWRRYGDRQLDQLMDEALATSPSLRAAQARVRQAAAVAGITGAAMSPQVNYGAHLDRIEASASGDIPPPLAGGWTWHAETALNFGYEVDFWGKH